jgi:hypothetical protein
MDLDGHLLQPRLGLVSAKDPPGGRSDLALGQYARGDLVKQRLEQIVLGPGDHRDIDRRIL